jgi:hypothetical protein
METVTTPPTVVGIAGQNQSNAGVRTWANNMITLGVGQATNTMIVGIWQSLFVTGGMNVHYNSIHIGGTVTSGSLNSYALLRSTVTNGTNETPIDFKNNILQNQRTGSTGKHYAIGNLTVNATSGWTGDNNLLNASPLTVARWNTSDLTFNGYKATSGQGGSSISNKTVTFTNINTGDLHLNMGTNGSPVESAGTAVSVTTDYDNQARPGGGGTANGGGQAPDIGADEFDGVPLDVTPPAITYTPLANTASTANRAVTNFATVSDLSGVNTASGTRPRLYFKRSTDANEFNDNTSATDGWKWVQATGTTSPFSFNINYALLNGGSVATGTTIQYFVVAQDIAFTPNVGINTGEFNADPATVNLPASAFPVTGIVNSYFVSQGYAGNINVGTGETITSLTNTGGLFQLLNSGALTANLTVNITSDLTAETGTVGLNQLSEDGVGGYTVTIKPTGAARTISGTTAAASGLIKLNGADRVTINGSLTGGAATDRSLTIRNLSSAASVAVIHVASASPTNGANFNIIKNCNILGNTTTTTFAGIASSNTNSPNSSAATQNSNNTYQNNAINTGSYGLLIIGASTNPDLNTLITGNTFGSSVAAQKLLFAGIYLSGLTNATVTDNLLSGIGYISTTTASQGIAVFTTLNSSFLRNRVTDVSNTGGGGAHGLSISVNTIPSNLTIANNMITGVFSTSTAVTPTANAGAMGIILQQGGGYNIYHNSVNMGAPTSTTGTSAALYVMAGVTTANTLDIRNNIFANTWTGSNRYAVYSEAANTVYGQINYNHYYSPNGSIGFIGSARATLADWQAGTGKDANSKSGDPLFNNNTNLAPLAGSPVLGAGTPVGITTDIIGVTRSGTNPSIGAYEEAGDFAAPNITYTLLTSGCSTGNRQVVATITDLTGVNTTTFKPRIYFRKNNEPFVSAAGTLQTGTATSGTWSFFISTAAMGGLTSGDVISYYVAAQDVSVNTNLGSSPAGVTGTNVNNIITHAPSNTYNIQATLAPGTYTVGTGGTYTTIAAAFNAYNTSCLTGPVVFSLISPTYTGGETLELKENATASATNTLTIRPATGINATIAGTSADFDVFVFAGADFIIVDGSNNGTNSRNLTIKSNSTTSGSDVVFVQSFGAGLGSKNNTIKNTIIEGGTRGTGASAGTVVTQWGMYVGTNLGGAQGLDNDNWTVENNEFRRVTVGLQAQSNAAGILDNWVVRNNLFGDAANSANSIGRTGVSLNHHNNLNMTGNTLTNITVADAGNATGILLGANVTNSTINKNIVTGIRYTLTTASWGARGIDIATTNAASNLTIHTNAISNIGGAGSNDFTANAVSGIRIINSGGVKLYFNTVNLGNLTTGTFTGNANGINSAALYVGSDATNLDIRNNIFATNLVNSATANARTYGIYSDAPIGTFTTMNNNSYSASGTQGVNAFIGSNRTTLAAIQAGFGQNTRSNISVPVFVTATDLHLMGNGNCSQNNQAATIAGIVSDIEGTNRYQVMADLGAYEFIALDNQWVGSVSSSWQNAANWCSNTIPGNTADITIPVLAAGNFYPGLFNNTTVRNLTLAAGSRMALNSYGLTVTGTLSGTGVFAATKLGSLTFSGTGAIGTLNMKSDSATLKSLSLTGTGATLTLGSPVIIADRMDIGGNTLATGGFLTIKSDQFGTASVGPVTGGITGNVTVERYISNVGKRAWRLLSVPTNTTQTIKQAWQENQAPLANAIPGYGTMITSPLGTAPGFDAISKAPSMLQFNQSTGTDGSLAGVTNTNTKLLSSEPGYFLFVRGDRSVLPDSATANTKATTLRTTGTLKTGTQAAITIPANTNVLVGNPYASAVDFTQIASNVSGFKVWDPRLVGTSGVGGYQTFSSTNGFDPIPGGGSYGSAANTRIESGQAFFVTGGSSAGSIQFVEAAKVTGSRNVFRTAGPVQQFKTRLLAETNNGSELADGNSIVFDNNYANGVDNDDVAKTNNFAENLAIIKNNSKLAIEARARFTADDVVNFSITNLKKQNYTLEFIPENMNSEGLTAHLVDNYLKSRTAISLSDTNRITFSVTTDAASAATDRFSVVFRTPNASIVTIRAQQKNNDVQVDWQVTGEKGTKAYEVEHSADGINFSKVNTTNASANGAAVYNYSFSHNKPVLGQNFYHVKSVAANAEARFSQLAKVQIGKGKSGISVYPNPVVNGQVSLQLDNQNEGLYTVRIMSKTGQVMYSQYVNHAGGSSNQQLRLPNTFANGTYTMEVLSADGQKSIQNLIINNK